MKNIIRPIVWINPVLGLTGQKTYYKIEGDSTRGYSAYFNVNGIVEERIIAYNQEVENLIHDNGVMLFGNIEDLKNKCEKHHQKQIRDFLEKNITFEAFEHLKLFDDSKNKFHNNNLNFDLDKISSYDEVDIEMDYDKNLVDKYIIRVNDNSYFYRERADRNTDYHKLKRMFVEKMS